MGVALLAQQLNNCRFQLGFGELHILFPVLSGRAPCPRRSIRVCLYPLAVGYVR